MELRVFDKTVQPLGAIDELASLLWHTKYFDVGTFSLLAPITDNNSRLLVEGNLITKHDGKKEVKTADGGVWRRAAQITYVHITKDENGLPSIMRRRSELSSVPINSFTVTVCLSYFSGISYSLGITAANGCTSMPPLTMAAPPAVNR